MMTDLLNKVKRWLLIRGSIGFVVFLLSSAVSSVIPFLPGKIIIFGLGWLASRLAAAIESRDRSLEG